MKKFGTPVLVPAFPGIQTHDPGVVSSTLYQSSYKNAVPQGSCIVFVGWSAHRPPLGVSSIQMSLRRQRSHSQSWIRLLPSNKVNSSILFSYARKIKVWQGYRNHVWTKGNHALSFWLGHLQKALYSRWSTCKQLLWKNYILVWDIRNNLVFVFSLVCVTECFELKSSTEQGYDDDIWMSGLVT